MTLKVYVSKPEAGPTIRLFNRFGYTVVDDLSSADIVAFNGGEDINPAIYNQKALHGAGVYWDDERDKIELKDYAGSAGKFKFGICRGGQLLNCLNGGSLWQDVGGHNHNHDMVDTRSGKTIYTSSVHHQMMIPGDGAELIAYAVEAGHKYGRIAGSEFSWFREDSFHPDQWYTDPEVLFYKKDRALCIQGHPEYSGYTQFTEYCMNLLEELYECAA